MKNILKLIISILIPLGGGFVIGLISNTSNYSSFVPAIVFPIVWTILYILMGISSYIIKENNGSLKTYYIQLLINFLWPIVFFNLNLRFVALLILFLLIYLVINMINEFKESSEVAAKLQIPYLLWLIFATLLNIMALFN